MRLSPQVCRSKQHATVGTPLIGIGVGPTARQLEPGDTAG